MKILILTHPLHTNYGGLLQAFALQKTLRELGGGGNDVRTIDWIRRRALWARVARFVLALGWRLFKKFILQKKGVCVFPKKKPSRDGNEMRRFVAENIRTTPCVNAYRLGRDLARLVEAPDAFVVGSDQVWRRAYIQNLPAFFLGFLRGNDTRTRRVAYAASFGIDFWDYTSAETRVCAALAQKFHAISVREDSGVALCEKHLGVRAEHLPDPTMLLSREDYCEIVARDEARGFLKNRDAETVAGGGNARRRIVLSYVLDETPEKRALVNAAARELGADAEARELMPRAEGAAFPPVSAWLRGFRDAAFVVTDSFHGCVFSVIFNKDFIAIGNAARGMARFKSLLKKFGLEERLIVLGADAGEQGAGTAAGAGTAEERVSAFVAVRIDWPRVNAIRSSEAARAREFLENALGGNGGSDAAAGNSRGGAEI